MTSIRSYPALNEAVQAGSDDDRIGVIGHLRDASELPTGVRIITQFGDVATLRLQRNQLNALCESDACHNIEASRRIRIPFDESSMESEETRIDASTNPVVSVRRPPGVAETGHGVVIGIIDWGLDIAHPAFLKDGRTRVRALWDQRGTQREENRWGYGRIYDRAEINAALETSNPYDALDYQPWLSDRDNTGSHGTHVASIAAGGVYPGGEPGVAPGAEIVFVHLARTPNVLAAGDLGDSVSVLEALDFIYEVAGDKPVVVNLSVGAHSGNHTGRSLVERGIDQSVWLQPGRSVVNSAGNYRQKAAHASGRLKAPAVATLPFVIPSDDLNNSEIEVFYRDTDLFDVVVVAPDGTTHGPVSKGDDLAIEIDDRKVGHLYHEHEPQHGDHHIDLFLYSEAAPGQWALQLKASKVIDGRYHAWIERDSSKQPFFRGPLVDSRTTIGTLANGEFSITVGAYDAHLAHQPIGEFSSSGPTRTGAIKPELVAPGVKVAAARSTNPGRQDTDLTTVKSGTSMAAPYVAGSVALMFEACKRPMEITETRALLLSELRGAGRCQHDACRKHDVHTVGYGYLDLDRLMRLVKHREELMDDHYHTESTDSVAPLDLPVPVLELSEDAPEWAPEDEDRKDVDLPLESEPFSDGVIDAAESSGSINTRLEMPRCETGCQRAPASGDVLVRRNVAEGVDYRAVMITDPQPNINATAIDEIVESRGSGWYARVIEKKLGSDLARYAIRKVMNADGSPIRGQKILPVTTDIDEHMPSDDCDSAFVEALPNLSAWQHLISFRPPVGVQRSLVRSYAPDWSVHKIEDAHGDINLDYYPIRVVRLPRVGGRTISAQELLRMLRLNIDGFIDTRISSFRPYNRASARRWRSSTPVGSVLHIDMKTAGGYLNPDDGSVVCARATASDWIFSTIWTPADFGHPVSGNRQFGFTQQNGEWIFYTRGADRTTGRVDSLMSGTVFSKADDLWRSLQRGLTDFINTNGGAAVYLSRTSRRYNWPAVKSSYWRPSTRWI
ncbi:MAG: S8 family serine peptidase [Pseudomonadota bacterium]